MYSIYTLSDPRNETVRYVGMSNEVIRRLGQHLQNNEVRCNSAKGEWIEALKNEGLKPRLSVLETVEDIEEAKEREKHWIKHFAQTHAPLVNTIGHRKVRIADTIPQPEQKPETVYRVKEAAKILGIHEHTVRHMIKDGRIDAFPVGKVYRIRQSALDAVMRGKKDNIKGDDEIHPA